MQKFSKRGGSHNNILTDHLSGWVFSASPICCEVFLDSCSSGASFVQFCFQSPEYGEVNIAVKFNDAGDGSECSLDICIRKFCTGTWV